MLNRQTIKIIKQIDVVVQILLLTGAITANFFKKERLTEGNLLIGSYFLVGGVQVLSTFIHFFIASRYKTKLRKIYVWLLMSIASIGLIILCLLPIKPETVFNGVIFFLTALFYLSPIMALLYVIVVSLEYKKLVKNSIEKIY